MSSETSGGHTGISVSSPKSTSDMSPARTTNPSFSSSGSTSTTSIGSTVDILNPVNLRQKDFQGDQNIHKSSDISSGDLNPSLNPSGRTGNTVSQVAGL